jgi:hypothetical protein
VPGATLGEVSAWLLDEPIGRIFLWNVMDHVAIGHLEPQLFAQAWKHCVDHSPAGRVESTEIIGRIQSAPTVAAGSSTPSAALLGRQRPRTLRRWQAEKLYSVTLTRRLLLRSNGGTRLAGAALTGANPTARALVLWVTNKPGLPPHLTADAARDRLGLVHHTVERAADLTLMEFDGSTLGKLSRPTSIVGGANARFYGVSQAEWHRRESNPKSKNMGHAADLGRIRSNTLPFTGACEAVCLADATTLASRVGDNHLGFVTRPAADDSAADPAFEQYLSRGRTRTMQSDFLQIAYVSVP